MSYRIEQKVGNNVYVYEAQSVWDKKKKQPRQFRTYIGKKDPKTGEIVKAMKKAVPVAAKDFGNLFLLKYLSEKIGLDETLRETFEDLGEVVVHLAYYLASDGGPLYLFGDWVERSFTSLDPPPDSRQLSRIVERID